MTKEIVVDINPFQTRVALLEDGLPCEIYIERRGNERLVGNIYTGRVQNILPGMQAAFVDIGLEKNAYLYAGDVQVDQRELQFGDSKVKMQEAPNIQDIVRRDQDIMVQVLREPVGTKGARVTTHVTLPGRTLVLMPTVNYVGVSRRIGDEAERRRLRECFERIKHPDMGVIVRTAAQGKEEAEFVQDLDFLVRLWERIKHKAGLVRAPRLLHAEEPLVYRTIRDMFTPDVDRLIINDREFFEKVEVVAGILSPTLKGRVEYYERQQPDLFEKYNLEATIDKALQRKVWLKNGGYIIIDQTEALTSIDVNTGKYVGVDNLQDTITQANSEAAREIARQLRLRDISGIIIIDFIDMAESADRDHVVEVLRQELQKDRTKSNVLGITSLGLVEMTRKKVRHCMRDTLQTNCPYCGGDGKILSRETVILKLRKQLLRCYAQQAQCCYLLRVHPDILELMLEHHSEKAPLLPREEGKRLYVQSDADMRLDTFEVIPITGPEEFKHNNGEIRSFG